MEWLEIITGFLGRRQDRGLKDLARGWAARPTRRGADLPAGNARV
ncbi:hypothetical protein OG381_46480 [Streptomyces sp. NBC_00490]